MKDYLFKLSVERDDSYYYNSFRTTTEHFQTEILDNKILDNKLLGMGPSPLHLAVQNNSIDQVLSLLQHGVDINAKDEYYKSPLSYSFNNSEITRILLDHGADVNWGAFGEAAEIGNIEVVKLYLDAGSKSGDFAFMRAVST